ncbi:MAG TPA: NAD(P)/FAD-dependent oxidoreductase [Actinomycetota bacterium]|nr:NAD(P)/FAD-dependent oxidoreductase [Actinomycetota bacterium]
MPVKHDALVVGGGHNGLVAAAYLARAGAKPVVLEARAKTGGAAATDTPWPEAPDFKVTTLSYVMSLMPPTIIRDLELERYGYKIFPMDAYYLAFPDGSSLKMFGTDAAHDRDEIAKFSKKDADAQPLWEAWLAGLADVLGPLLMQVPPRVGSKRPRDLLEQLKLAWRVRGLDVRGVGDVTKLMTMSIADLLDEWFESPQIKAAHAINGVIGTWAGPAEPGTAYVMAHHSIGDVGDGRLGSWGFPAGGMGAVSDSIRRSAEASGAVIRTDAPVARIKVDNERVTGVVLADGEELSSEVVVAATHPQTTFLQMMEPRQLPDDFVRDIERWRTRSGVVKINVALAELPDFVADPGVDPAVHGGAIELAHSVEYIERAFQDAREGRAAERPFSDGCIPSFFDRSLCPEGTHIMSMFTQWVPQEWSREPMRDELEAYADRVIDGYTELAPNLKGAILHRQVIGPYDMEQEWGLIGGNIFHGELSAEQLFHMRPAPGYADYRSPVAGLYQASSATHGGGGVCGIPGFQAARAITRDRKKTRRQRQST